MTQTPAWLAPALAYIPQWLGYQMRATEQPGVTLAVAYKGREFSIAFNPEFLQAPLRVLTNEETKPVAGPSVIRRRTTCSAGRLPEPGSSPIQITCRSGSHPGP